MSRARLCLPATASGSEAGWDDYAGLDVQDRVDILAGEPGSEKKDMANGTKEPSWSSMRNAKREIADSLGAAAIIVVTEEYETLKSRFVPWLSRERMRLDVEREVRERCAHLVDGPEALLTMTGWKSLDFARKKWPKQADPVSWRCKLALARKDDRVVAHNVWGLIPGSDSTLSDEIVVLTSHYDHVGVDKEETSSMAPMTTVEP